MGAAVAEQEEEERQAEARRMGVAAHNAKMRAAAVDLFSATPLNWIQAGAGYALSGGDTTYSIQPSFGDSWRLPARRRDFDPVTMFDGSVSMCQGIAEDACRRAGASALVARDAPWRSRGASEKQIAALGRFKFTAPPDMTAGEASDKLSEMIARRGR